MSDADLLRRRRRSSAPGSRSTTRPRPRSGSATGRRHTGKPSLVWSEAVDEALCFGWIDGVLAARRRRAPHAALHAAQADEQLERGQRRQGREAARGGPDAPGGRGGVRRAGAQDRSGVYSYEQRASPRARRPSSRRASRRTPEAWEWFQARPPSYRTKATWWVISAKRPETRARRLATLIADCAAGERIKPLRPPRPKR